MPEIKEEERYLIYRAVGRGAAVLTMDKVPTSFQVFFPICI